MMSRFQKLLRCARHMFSRYEPLRRPVFSPDENLELRQAMQRDLIGDRPVKALIESNPDTWVRPINYDEDGLPNG